MTDADARRLPALQTRERILDEAERLIALKGVFGFKLRDIADPLDVQVQAIYKHYKSRDDVMIEVSKRFISMLAQQFQWSPTLEPEAALRDALDRFVEFKMNNPAYVRLAFADFATPNGGMEYVKLAAGGSFNANFSGGPLAGMHSRLGRLLRAAARARLTRAADSTDFYRLVKAALMIRLVFPSDELLLRKPSRAEVRAVQRWLWRIAAGLLVPPVPPAARRRTARA